MRYGEVAAAMVAEGYLPYRAQKRPQDQLRNSLWTLLMRDPRFVKVGHGLFDLADRAGTRSS